METSGSPIEPDLTPIDQPEPTAQDYIAPDGGEPSEIPDPMPDDLQPTDEVDEAFDRADGTEGDAPTG
jgi:hypothetical protein